MKTELTYNKLRGRIVEKYGTLNRFAEAMGWTLTTQQHKLLNRRAWDQDEIMQACSLLDIELHEIPEYFFTPKV